MADPTPLQTALASWRNLDLPSLRPSLSSTATTLLESKEKSLKARKHLAENTKSLKRAIKLVESDGSHEHIRQLAAEAKDTIKSYQEEIDSLTRRCKLAENSFVSLYTSIYECRDPASALTEAIELIESRDGQVENLLRGMEELNEEVEALSGERDGLRMELDEMKSGGGPKDELGGGGELSLVEREELIRLRGEVAEYEGRYKYVFTYVVLVICENSDICIVVLHWPTIS